MRIGCEMRTTVTILIIGSHPRFTEALALLLLNTVYCGKQTFENVSFRI
jgi:hypothetical protein